MFCFSTGNDYLGNSFFFDSHPFTSHFSMLFENLHKFVFQLEVGSAHSYVLVLKHFFFLRKVKSQGKPIDENSYLFIN